MKPADQTHVAPVTEDAPHPASTMARTARAERLRDYFALQLHFAEVVAANAALPLTDAVAQYTNFYRRFGFGPWRHAHRPSVAAVYGPLAEPGNACPTCGLDANLLCAVAPERLPPGGSSLAALGAILPMRPAGYAFTSRTMIPMGSAR